jgi:signal transduction histidine kinase
VGGSIAGGLRSPELESYSLVAVAERAVRDHERRSGTHVELVVSPLPQRAPLAIKIALHRILQEALSNATRHGRPTAIRVTLSTDGVTLHVAIRDDGAGFASERLGNGLGLAGMRERAELLGGSFAVESTPTAGTQVVVSLPLLETSG